MAASPRASDALSNFFRCCDSISLPQQSVSVTPRDWREHRKTFLTEYFRRRLDGDDDIDGEDLDEECSFCSAVLDESFRADNNTAEGYQEASDSFVDDSVDFSEPPPSTQPDFIFNASTTTPTRAQHDASMDESRSINSGTLLATPLRIIAGIKRTFGFFMKPNEGEKPCAASPDDSYDTATPRLNSQPDYTHENNVNASPPLKKKKRLEGPEKRGIMWNGSFRFVPHISDANRSISTLDELDLFTQSIDLTICRVLRIWDLRSTRRMDGMIHNREHTEESDKPDFDPLASRLPYLFYEDDGPLNTLYNKVLSIEIVQMDHDEHDSRIPSNTTRIDDIVTAAFRSGSERSKDIASRRRRHTVRRVRIFFYNGYAQSMHEVLRQLRNRSSDRKKLTRFLMALSNVPSHCIMPYSIASKYCHPELQQYIDNPFVDEEYGALSPFCICIGDGSSVKIRQVELCFESDDVEIRLVQEPDLNCLESDIGVGVADLDNAILNRDFVGGIRYEISAQPSILIQQYMILSKGKKRQAMTFLPGHLRNNRKDSEALNEEHALVSDGEGVFSRGHLTVEVKNQHGATESEFIRPSSVLQLASLLPLLLKNGSIRRNGRRIITDAVSVYGIVLGFSPPSRTSANDWKMSVVLMDETLPLSNDQDQSGDCPPVSPNCGTSKVFRVPSITLNLFVKDKSYLPMIRSAGDLISCYNVTLQEYNDEPQLLCSPKKGSGVIIIHPLEFRCPGAKLLDSTSPEDWSVSCSCHGRGEDIHPSLDWRLANNLWRWGQQRLASYPTISPNCKFTIAELDNHTDMKEVSVSGDLTAAITEIIPIPEHCRRSDTPRGYIRLWDGTGPPRSDPHPPDVDRAYSFDPPETLLVTIEKIVDDLSSRTTDDASSFIAAPIALTGRVINATIWEQELWQLIRTEKQIEVGSFVRLRNINNTKMLPLETNCLSVHNRSFLTPLPFDAYEVKLMLKDHNTRIQHGASTIPSSGILPSKSQRAAIKNYTTNLQLDQFTTLKNCLQQTNPTTFTIRFEISGTIPSFDPSNDHSIQSLCCKNRDGSIGFRFAFHIQDSSAQMDVLCLGAVAENLLGVKVHEVTRCESKTHKAVDSLNKILKPGLSFDGDIRSVIGKDKKMYYILTHCSYC